MNSRKKRDQGFIGLIILVIIALVLLKYFLNWSVFDAAASPQGQSTISYTHNLWDTIWSYISTPVTFIWQKIVWPLILLIWNNFNTFLKWGKNPTSVLGN